jgi:glycosyltransferase involved in cell wall biosynthesis
MPASASPAMSIVLPVYNGARHLRECLESILAQRERSFELLIGDDASTDESKQILAGYQDPRIHVYRSERNRGLFANLNELLRRARAELVRFACQDDILGPTCVQQEVDFFARHPEIGMSYCKAFIIDEEGSTVEQCTLGDVAEVLPPKSCLPVFYFSGCIPGNLTTVCMRRQSLEQVGRFNEAYRVSGDYELWTRVCSRYPLGILHQHLVSLRRHNNQLSRARTSGPHYVKENRQIRDRLLGHLSPRQRRSALWFRLLRFNVLDTHLLVRRLVTGRVRDGWLVARALGGGALLAGLFCWVLTLNNRLYRPRPNLAFALEPDPRLE